LKPERLQKYLAACGRASRRQAERLILQGRVRVDGRPVSELGLKIDPLTSRVEVDGQLLQPLRQKVWLALNKPRGYLTSAVDPRGRPTVYELLAPQWSARGPNRVYYVGRLDMDSEGLLLFTSDGQAAHRLTHPSSALPRRYRLKLLGRLGEGDRQQLLQGVELEDGPARLSEIKILKESGRICWVEVEVREGRNRLLRRLFQALEKRVLRLVRVEYAGVKLGRLASGKFRTLTPAEISGLGEALEAEENA
jgi:23S rRNA pseudouridine2605 synthase